jgi:hypothetical protein
MSYTIYKSDGTAVVVADNAIDPAYYNTAGGNLSNGLGTQLVGRNTINYGAPVAQNFLQMTENFASLPVPSDATSLQGQLWFNKTNSTSGNLYVRKTGNPSGGIANWEKIVTLSPDQVAAGGSTPTVYTSSPVSANAGDILVIGSVISIYANGAWRQVFPAVYS